MKRMFKDWRKWVLKEYIDDYDSGGTVTLYHYSKLDADSIMLDPQYFLTNRSIYSRNDYQASSYPRIFFYLDTKHTETVVKGNNPYLYSVDTPISDIYNLVEDPEDLIEKSKKATGQVKADVHKILKSLAKDDYPHPKYPEYFKPIRDEDAKRYKGVYYRIYRGTVDVVVWFNDIEATRAADESEEL